jgi:hypothetical protein
MPMSRALKEFVECLNSNRVEYLIVGALAVSWHGFPRYSGDIDFFIRPTLQNAQRVKSALAQFGFGELDISLTDLTAAGKVIQLGYEPKPHRPDDVNQRGWFRGHGNRAFDRAEQG